MDDKPTLNKEQIEQYRDEAIQGAYRLMTHMETDFQYPAQALVASMFACATLAHGIDMPLDVLVDGIRAAYRDLVKAESEGAGNAH